MLIVSELFIYPVKSLGGIPVSSVTVTDRGFEYDRRWMLVDENNHFLSQRQIPQMAFLQTEITGNGIKVFHKQKATNNICIPFLSSEKQIITRVWDDTCTGQHVNDSIDQWFSTQLKIRCKLVYMPDNSHRKVDAEYRIDDEITSFSDGYPFLMIGQSSLDDLNSRLSEPIQVYRFRPNIVFTGGSPFEEDEMKRFKINHLYFSAVKPCARCMITAIDPNTALKGAEPLKTLSSYRMKNNKIYFGQNLLHEGIGQIQVGDMIEIIQHKDGIVFC